MSEVLAAIRPPASGPRNLRAVMAVATLPQTFAQAQAVVVRPVQAEPERTEATLQRGRSRRRRRGRRRRQLHGRIGAERRRGRCRRRW